MKNGAEQSVIAVGNLHNKLAKDGYYDKAAQLGSDAFSKAKEVCTVDNVKYGAE